MIQEKAEAEISYKQNVISVRPFLMFMEVQELFGLTILLLHPCIRNRKEQI